MYDSLEKAKLEAWRSDHWLPRTRSRWSMWLQRRCMRKIFVAIELLCILSVIGVAWIYICIKTQDFPGGAAVENPPASAGDTGSSPGPGGSRVPRSNWARVPQLLSLRSRAREPQLLSPWATTTEACAPRAGAPKQEKPPQWDAHAPQRRVAPAHHNWRKPARSNEDPTQPKINK